MIRNELSPDTVKAAVRRVDGGLTILVVVVGTYEIVNGVRVKTSERDPVEAIERALYKFERDGVWTKENGKKHVDWEIVHDSFTNDTGTDITYRDAWVHTPGAKKPGHDIVRAREIQRVYLRKARLAEFCRLDNDYRIADEANDHAAKAEIGRLRQKFRDVTADPRIDEAQTVEELKKLRLDYLIPETLGERHTDKMRTKSVLAALKNTAEVKR